MMACIPLSANSPDGPISLIRADPLAVESMRARNREEKVFTAKCCGAPLSIRTAEGKVPHFVHLSTPANCEGGKRETPEHRRLKYLIAEKVMLGAEWDVETEVFEFDPDTQRVIWRADVLARRPKATVAFEVQLSNADFEHMSERQARYKRSDVRGLWFVRTKKGFPLTKELPVFTIESTEQGDWVQLSTRWDLPGIWNRTSGEGWMELPEFIEAALSKRLKWAPFLGKPETVLDADIGYFETGQCSGCGRTLAEPMAATACSAQEDEYPDYHWSDGLKGLHRRSNWLQPLVDGVWAAAAKEAAVSFHGAERICLRCRAPVARRKPDQRTTGTLSARLRLGDLPKPAFGTEEWKWLRRWVVVDW